IGNSGAPLDFLKCFKRAMVDNSLDMDVPTLFASNLQTFSNNTVTDLQYAGLTRDEALSREALQVAAGLFEMWDQRPKRLQDEDWTEEAASPSYYFNSNWYTSKAFYMDLMDYLDALGNLMIRMISKTPISKIG
ncbi:hypothetical protein C0991_012450, partial [Blastosporella zonata]